MGAQHPTVRDGSLQQTAQPSLGLRGKRAREPVPPSKPERRRVAAELMRQHHEHKRTRNMTVGTVKKSTAMSCLV